MTNKMIVGAVGGLILLFVAWRVYAGCNQAATSIYYNTNDGCQESKTCTSTNDCQSSSAVYSVDQKTPADIYCACGSLQQYCYSVGQSRKVDITQKTYQCSSGQCAWTTVVHTGHAYNQNGDVKSDYFGCPSQ